MDQQIQNELKQQVKKVFELLHGDLGTIRTGRATPALVENVIISAYGNTTKLKIKELATIGITDSQTIVITPFDASIIEEIQKGIEVKNLLENVFAAPWVKCPPNARDNPIILSPALSVAM